MNDTNPRAVDLSAAAAVIEDLEKVLIDFMRKHRITHDQYRAATQVLIDSIKQGEESLLLDVFFEAEATDIGNVGRQGSPEAIEGPFYMPGAPMLDRPCVMPMRDGERGDILFFSGRITDTSGRPIPAAELDLWHADADGFYSNIHPGIPDWNLRGRFLTDMDGRYEVRTIMPPPYEIPKAGPTGAVLSLLGRHYFRPAHLHVKVWHAEYGEMTSQLYFEGGEYLDNDVANAVREGLFVKLQTETVPEKDGNTGTKVFRATYDFVLPVKV